ncbi:MAG: terminase [Porphyromonadaceae bacterium]|jgi:putative ATPase subunit of terminase (gpP-like)|uniref:ATPase subunit of terminase (GpP like) n=2 Tax=unclassified Caudoviricetes TaxID=2788787 RepID=A0A8S5N5F1_9CAUD|nr:terminase [Porphyromonadaceae bacterium]DAD89498.1 MAG TPA: Putative ATPase subunit of terminase (gpP like) [Myoviridae sp. ctO4916]DAF58471.1 MAG TPA: Putative ATPase subunit of terminase (gpP like) [Myoviridae sp. ctLIM9]DAR66361.1 MAG TPA: Putative ATPase subunit of terminase (gpP like) [Caudoviricetes sp.]
MTAREREEKRELARLLYLQGKEQKSIAVSVNVSEATISKWVQAGQWQSLRAAQHITRPELVNKILLSIDKLLTDALNSNDPAAAASLGKQLKGFSDAIEKLDKKANVVTAIEVFIAFGKWMEHRMSIDTDLTPELIKTITKYQDLYVTQLMASPNQ